MPFTGDTAKAQSMLYRAVGTARARKDWKPVARTVSVLVASALASAMVSSLRELVLGEDEDKALLAGERRLAQEIASLLPGGSFLSTGASRLIDLVSGRQVHNASVIDVPVIELANGFAEIGKLVYQAIDRAGERPRSRRTLTSGDLAGRAAEKLLMRVGELLGVPTQYWTEVRRGIAGWTD